MTTNRTAIVNVIVGSIRIETHGEETDIDHDADGRTLFLLADLEPWDAEEESMDRADAALADMGYIYVLDVFVNPLISKGVLVEILPEWSTYGRTFFSVTPKSRFVAPRTRAFIDYMAGCLDAQRRIPVGVQVSLEHGRK